MLSMYCGTAHAEDDKISRRTKDGIHGTLLKGKCPNKAPRGYINKRNDRGEAYVEIDETQANAIRQAFKEISKGVETANCIRRRICPFIPRGTFFKMLHNIFYKGEILVPPLLKMNLSK